MKASSNHERPPKGPIDDPEDENALWVQLTKDVRPLKRQKSLDSEPSKPKPARTKKKKHVHHTPQTPPNIRKPQNTQLDKRTDERLRKGQIPIEAHLDLHGFNQEQAHSAVNRFVQSAYHAHKRCVLIITGKGQTDADGLRDPLSPSGGILKQKLPQWLTHAPLASIVLKTYPAKPKDGGHGALYVYLRRNKE